jgi:hypothetical protein
VECTRGGLDAVSRIINEFVCISVFCFMAEDMGKLGRPLTEEGCQGSGMKKDGHCADLQCIMKEGRLFLL